MSRFFKSAAFPILIVLVLALFAQQLISPGNDKPTPTYSAFIKDLNSGGLEKVTLKPKDSSISVTPKKDSGIKPYEVGFVKDSSAQLQNQLEEAQAAGKITSYNIESTKTNAWISLLTYVLPFLIFIIFWIFLMNQVQGGGSKVMSFGKSKAKRMSVDSPKITFRDVAGAAGLGLLGVLEELLDLVELLHGLLGARHVAGGELGRVDRRALGL